MKTFKFSLVLRTRENTDVFITFDDNIYGIHSKRVNILYVYYDIAFCNSLNMHESKYAEYIMSKLLLSLKFHFPLRWTKTGFKMQLNTKSASTQSDHTAFVLYMNYMIK